ncbi:hypothetical protein GCM10009839_50650 [Catenulispora yoronensis]|uniref:Uncharacterized protein n=1 Tax=Catenulispora yoronensis TaxID=450799 RepID=A0ABN2USA9_9ACTN
MPALHPPARARGPVHVPALDPALEHLDRTQHPDTGQHSAVAQHPDTALPGWFLAPRLRAHTPGPRRIATLPTCSGRCTVTDLDAERATDHGRVAQAFIAAALRLLASRERP